LIFAALAASGLVVADVLLDEAGRLLSGTQDELGSLRDAKAREDSDNKELKIADANRLAGEANRRAEELAQENLRLKRAIDRSVAETLLREEELKAKNLATESKLEEELKTRLELEKSLTPRELPIILEGPKANFDSLRPFAEMQVIFDVLPDAEAVRAASNLRQILEMAGWKTAQFVPRADANIGFFDGVVIESLPSGAEMIQSMGNREQAVSWQRLDKAGEALEDFLSSYNWEARATFREPNAPPIPANTIKIVVGFKPNPYFAPEWVKKAREESRKVREEMKRRRVELEKLFPKRPNE